MAEPLRLGLAHVNRASQRHIGSPDVPSIGADARMMWAMIDRALLIAR